VRVRHAARPGWDLPGAGRSYPGDLRRRAGEADGRL